MLSWAQKLVGRANTRRVKEDADPACYVLNDKDARRQITFMAGIVRGCHVWSLWGQQPENQEAVLAEMRVIKDVGPEEDIPLCEGKWDLACQALARIQCFDRLLQEEKDEFEARRASGKLKGEFDG